MSKVISFRLGDERLERLQRTARAMNRTPGEAAAIRVEEGMRLREFPGLEFRDTAIGRQAYVRGTRLPVWQVALIARDYDENSTQTASHLGLTNDQVALAFAYISLYRGEIDAAIADNEAAADRLALTLPVKHVITI